MKLLGATWKTCQGENFKWTRIPQRHQISKLQTITGSAFPKAEIVYRVTTKREFRQTVDQFFGAVERSGAADKNNAGFDPNAIAAAENALVNRINTIIIDAFRQQGAADISIALRPGADRIASRFHKDGSLESIRGSLMVNFQVGFPDADEGK